jgi:ABC-2 type transport system permease protein
MAETAIPAAPQRRTLPTSTLRRDIQAVKIVWHRELINFSRNRVRIVVAFVQPLLLLFVLANGLTSVTRGATHGLSYQTFVFPGVLATTVLMPSFFAAGSIVYDREFGFLREMLVAPVRRGSIVIGKCLGGATVATIQGVAMLALAGLVHVPYNPLMLLTLTVECALLSFALVALGVMAAARITQFQSFMAVVQLLMLPLMFLSGTLFPLTGLPGWLHVATSLDPITYAVDPLRRAVFAHLAVSDDTRRVLDPGVSWFGWHVPTMVELGIVVAMGLIMLTIAIFEFRKLD